MPGLVKIWWHDGAVKDIRYHDIPVVNEPELAFESLAVGGVPASSGPAPGNASVAIVETDVSVRYYVRHAGDITVADATNSKPIAATGLATDSIGILPGCTISFVEADS